ncbi:MAG: hypothetical protein K2W93_20425 [Burkholderiaceae bacterium]|nr:hypothetical protein [Burkholderiaceae bacterium]
MTAPAAIALLAAAGLMAGLVQAAELPSAGLQSCRALTEAKARLSCYDALADQAAKQPQAPAASTAPLAVAATATTTAAVPVADTFGLTNRPKNEPNVISGQIDGLFEGWGPNQIIYLSNGQAWQVIDGSRAVVYLKNPKVEIRKAAMGSFMLELEGSNETARVKRLR